MKLGIVGSGIIAKEFLSIAHHLKNTMILSLCCTKKRAKTKPECLQRSI